MSSAPNVFVYLRRFEQGLMGSWRIVAERGQAKSTPAWTPVLAKPQEVPLVRNVRVTGRGAEPRVSWELPDLTGFDIDRIRVGIRGGKLLYERFMFEVMLEDLERGVLENRSLTFSEPYTVSR